MFMPDVNVLIYAHRGDEQYHEQYRRWLEDLVNGQQPFALSALVAVAFVRIVTHRKFSKSPTPLSQALAVIDALVGHPNCRLLGPGPKHWQLVADLCRRGQHDAAAVADAQHAAVAIENGCTWVSRDSDFYAFSACGLHWQHLDF